MQKRIIEGVEVQRSSGNVFADLGLPDAEKLKIKTGLVVEIRRAMRALGLTQQAAAKRMGIPQPKVSGMMRGDFTNLSERKLMDCLNRLGYDIEIKVRPAADRASNARNRLIGALLMAARITDDEWDELTPENFDTTALLRAVDAVDVLRGDLNDSADGAPPQLRTDLLKLHQLAMAAFNEGSRSRVAELFDLAVDLQDQVDHLMTSLEQVQETLSRLTALYPESLS